MEVIASNAKQKRKRAIEPDLVNNDHAKGWAFAVTAAFRSAFDIQWSQEVKDKTVIWEGWTQGGNFAFSAGDMLYDTAEAYEATWAESFKKITTCVQVTAAISANSNAMSEGSVTFLINHPNLLKGSMVNGQIYNATQKEFVGFLRTGQFRGQHHGAM